MRSPNSKPGLRIECRALTGSVAAKAVRAQEQGRECGRRKEKRRQQPPPLSFFFPSHDDLHLLNSKTEKQTSTRATTSAASRSPLLVEAKVAIRFQRFGRKKAPFYRLVAIDSRDRREGRPLERLGFYDPLKKETNLNAPAIKKWLAVGAQPSETVANLLKKAMVLEE